MTTRTIDIPLPPELEQYLGQPACIPLPKPASVELTLPTGGKLKGIADISKGIPDECTLSFSLLLQLAPLLGGIECLVRLLKLVKPLVDIVNGLTEFPPSPPARAVADFARAAEELAPCFALPTPLAMVPFVRDIFCLMIKLLSCVIGQLRSIIEVLGGLTLQIQPARVAGNAELLAALECAQQNAQTSAQHIVSAIDPILAVLALAEPFLGIAGVNPIAIPAIAMPEDTAQIRQTVDTLEELVQTLKLAAESLGGC